MRNYLNWICKQIWLLLFQPSKFIQRVNSNGQSQIFLNLQLPYLIKMLPMLFLIQSMATLLGVLLAMIYDIDYWWAVSNFSLMVTISLFFILIITNNVALATMFSIVFGIGSSMVLGLVPNIAPTIPNVADSYDIFLNIKAVASFGAIAAIFLGLLFVDFAKIISFCTVFSLVAGSMTSLAGSLDNQSMIVVKIIFGDYLLNITSGVLVAILAGITAGIVIGVTYYIEKITAFGVIAGVFIGSLTSVMIDSANSVTVCLALFASLMVTFFLVYFRIFHYPVDAIVSCFAYLAAASNPQTAFHWWKICPICWNEVIYFPLPGASKLLVLATRQNHEMGFQQILFVTTERPLQQKVAIKAFKQVVIGDLDSNNIQELASLPDRMAWITKTGVQSLPEGLSNIWPLFERIGYHTRQLLSVSSTYRKADMLKQAMDEVNVLQKTLFVYENNFYSQILIVVNQWHDILESEHERIHNLTVERRETLNPFVFGNPVDERNSSLFVGRLDVIRQIEESILGSQYSPTLLLYGPRRMGKTSILKQLPRLLGADFVPAMLDCQHPKVAGAEASAQSLLMFLSVSLSNALRQRHINVPPLTFEELGPQPYANFDVWLDHVENAMPLPMRALLCLDEYERLQRAFNAGWGGDFLDALRHILQHRQRFVVLFAGSHSFFEMGPDWTDRFISTRRVRVSFLKLNDVPSLLLKPIPEFDLNYCSGVIEKLIVATNGQPYIIQTIAFELVQYLNEQHRKEATLCDVEMAITRALDSGGDYFASVWRDVGERGRVVLTALASGKQHSISPEIYKWLCDRDILNNDGKIAVPMLERWIIENAVEYDNCNDL